MLRTLAVETSTGRGSLALLEDAQVVRQCELPAGQRTAQSLAPAIEQALAAAQWPPSSVGLVAVTNGPGSFTGLRIGVTTAKTFAYACTADLIAINTLDVLAAQTPADSSTVCAIMDAQRRQLFAAVYHRRDGGPWTTAVPCRIFHRQELADQLPPNTILTGPALTRLDATFATQLPRADPNCWTPQAATVGLLAWHAHRQGRRDDLFALRPEYYRPSYAEEKREAPPQP